MITLQLLATNAVSLVLGFLIGRMLWALTDWRSSHTVADYQLLLESAILWSAALGPATAAQLAERVGLKPGHADPLIQLLVDAGHLHRVELYAPDGQPRAMYVLPQQGA